MIRAAVSVLVASFATLGIGLAPAAGAAPTPAPKTPIQHFVTVMQEGHSFDNYFGTYPGADGIPANVCMPTLPSRPQDGCSPPFAIGKRGSEALSSTRQVFDSEYAQGQMNGFVSTFSSRGVASNLAMAHYVQSDLSYYWDVAQNYVLFDQYFGSARGGSLRNHMYWMTGTPGDPNAEKVPTNGFRNLPTIFDRLQAKNISWKVYIENYDPTATYRATGRTSAQLLRAPVLAFARFLDDPSLSSHIVPINDYYTDLAQGTLPAVSYVVPAGSSEHPPARVASGEAFIRNLIAALKRSSAWPTSALLWSYADWGGWYDHVVPPTVDRFGLGFRVPGLLVSPYAKRGYVDNTRLDHTSVLKFIEDNWGLQPLASRDAHANDLTSAFDWQQPPRPPELLAIESPSPLVVHGKRAIIYPAYGAAALFALVLIVIAAAPSRRRRRAQEAPA